MLIEMSIDIKSVIQNLDEKASSNMQRMTGFQVGPPKSNTNLQDGIHDLEMRINKMMHATQCKDLNVVEIKNHLVDLYLRVGVSLLKKHLQFQDKIQNCNNEWQVTCDQLINETQALKAEREKTDNEH